MREYLYRNELIVKYEDNIITEENKNGIFLIEKKTKENKTYYKIRDNTEILINNSNPINFEKFIYKEIEKVFNEYEIYFDNNKLYLTNKKDMIMKIDKIFDSYLLKYKEKLLDINFIFNEVKKGLKGDYYEIKLEGETLLVYLFNEEIINKINKNQSIESQTLEIYSDYYIPTVISYDLEYNNSDRVIKFTEKLNQKKLSKNLIKIIFKEILGIDRTENFPFDFIIEGNYVFDKNNRLLEINVTKNIIFGLIETKNKRKLTLIRK